MKLEELAFKPIEIKKFDWSFSVSWKLFDILKIPEKLILWPESENEVFLFSQEKWDWFYHAMCIEMGYNKIDVRWTNEGDAFFRRLNEWSQRVDFLVSNKIQVPSKTRLKKLLEWKDFKIKICV